MPEEAVQQLLRSATPSLREVAEGLGVSYDTVRAWSSGRAHPSPANREKLRQWCEEHVASLRDVASAIDGASEDVDDD